MISIPESITPSVRRVRSRLFRGVSLLVVAGALSASLLAQTDAAATDANTNANGRQRRGNQNGNGGNGNGGGGRNGGNFDPADVQARMMTALREQFGVTDDAEWKLIEERVTTVTELRRSAMTGGLGGGFGGRGGGGLGGGGGGRGNRAGAVANPEMDALRAAVTDKLPDAEVKARLARVRETRKQNEAKLEKAQEDLRAVLTVRQEALAVMAGLLP